MLPEDTLGSLIERALTNPERSLEQALAEDARRMVAIVNSHVASRRNEALVAHEETLAQWRQP